MNVTQLLEILKDEHPDRKILIDASRMGSSKKELRPVFDVVVLRIETGEKFLVLSYGIEQEEEEEE